MNFIASSLAAVTTFTSPISNIEFNMLALTPKEVEIKLDSIILFTPSNKDGTPISFEFDVNGDKKNKVANITNVSFSYVEGESLIMALKDVAVSSGSACTSASLEPSYVLRALGRPDELAHSSIRFSFGRFTTKEEVKMVAETTKRVVKQLRELSPLWDMYLDGVDLEKVEWVTH